MKLWQKNIILAVLVVILAVVPLVVCKGAEFGGADGEAEEAIGEIDPDYEPWAESVVELPGGERLNLRCSPYRRLSDRESYASCWAD